MVIAQRAFFVPLTRFYYYLQKTVRHISHRTVLFEKNSSL